MVYLRRWMLCCTVVLMAISTVQVKAAPPADPLLSILARIPDSPLSRNIIFYENTLAIESAYPPAKPPTSVDALSGTSSSTKDASKPDPTVLWMQIFKNMLSPVRSIGDIADMPTVMGFDFFSIQQSIDYGVPPADASQLYGNFDADQVRKAFAAQGFTRSDRSDVELWCGANGCDKGMELNIGKAVPANLFGGTLGRQQPLIIGDGYLISSASNGFIQQHIDVINKKAKSLADAPEYQAVVNAITANGILLQATFVEGQDLSNLTDLTSMMQVIINRGGKNTVRKLLQDQLKSYQPLPPFQLLAFADTATDTEQVGLIALVYDHADDAKTASTIIPARFDSDFSAVDNRPFKGILTARNVSAVTTQIVNDAATGKTVLLVVLATPKATPEQIFTFATDPANAPKVTSPGLVYHFLVQGLESRDTSYLSTVPREALEQQLQGLGG